ncbi:mast cell protease 1A-like [Emydura macquarii macquarii]|uniref:mast cell protease 1A-like n=1 Tax=Emydura macquarii macquarii TaxID=1129001 RepID=UPI00352BC1BE
MQVYIWLLLPMALLLPPGARSGEIIGGREARPHSRPYMAFLKIQDGKNISHCGGFLVSEDFVLTAAHCNGAKITVYLGAHNLKSKREQRRQVITARAKICHPRYNKKTQNYDIMLLQLEKKAELNRCVNPIRLPPAHQRVRPGTKCSIAGWGRTSPHIKLFADKLQKADVVVMPDATCTYCRSNYNPSTMLCAGDPEEGKNPFEGDSGGPLVCRGMAQGIVSYGSANGTPPAVYTRVSIFVPWIEKMMRKLQP